MRDYNKCSTSSSAQPSINAITCHQNLLLFICILKKQILFFKFFLLAIRFVRVRFIIKLHMSNTSCSCHMDTDGPVSLTVETQFAHAMGACSATCIYNVNEFEVVVHKVQSKQRVRLIKGKRADREAFTVYEICVFVHFCAIR